MRNLTSLILIFSLSIINYAQDFSFKSYVDQNNISTDDYIRFIIESNERIQFNNLSFKDFVIKQGPYTSSSSQTTIINGKFESKKEFKSTFILVPKNDGNLIIEPITVNFGGKNYSTNIINISVSKGQKTIKKQTVKKPSNSDSKLFAKITTTKLNPYLGENLLVQYKIYQSVYHVRNIEITDYDLNMSNDFWTELIEPKNKRWKEEQEIINGIQYSVFTLKKEIISPQKSGKLTIPSFEVSTIVNRDFFNRGLKKDLKSNQVVLNVKNLPKNAPKSFKGQVGNNYKLKVTVSKNELKVDEALDIGIEISGNGNLKQLYIPEIKYPQDLEQFPEETKSNIKISSNGISGKKQMSQLLIPRFHGEFSIPEVAFTYFDTYSKKYKTLSYPSSKIKVAKNNSITNSNTTNFNRSQQVEVSVINENIHHIKLNTQLHNFSEPIFGSFYYWLLVCAIPSTLFILLLLMSNKEKFTDKNKLLMKKALGEININFKNAEKQLENQENNAFYQEIYKLWNRYLSCKFKLEVSNLNKENINETLNSYGVSKTDIESLERILNYCEMAQYSPFSNESAQYSYDKSRLLFNKFEKNV